MVCFSSTFGDVKGRFRLHHQTPGLRQPGVNIRWSLVFPPQWGSVKSQGWSPPGWPPRVVMDCFTLEFASVGFHTWLAKTQPSDSPGSVHSRVQHKLHCILGLPLWMAWQSALEVTRGVVNSQVPNLEDLWNLKFGRSNCTVAPKKVSSFWSTVGYMYMWLLELDQISHTQNMVAIN